MRCDECKHWERKGRDYADEIRVGLGECIKAKAFWQCTDWVAPNFVRELGVFQVNLNYPQGGGYAATYAKAQALRDAFFQGKTFTSGNITVIVSRTPTISPGRNDGDRWVVPIKISFFANVYG